MLGDLAGEGWTESFLENLELHSGDRRPCGHDPVSGFVAHAHCQSPKRYQGAGTGATASSLGILGTGCCSNALMGTGSSYGGLL